MLYATFFIVHIRAPVHHFLREQGPVKRGVVVDMARDDSQTGMVEVEDSPGKPRVIK